MKVQVDAAHLLNQRVEFAGCIVVGHVDTAHGHNAGIVGHGLLQNLGATASDAHQPTTLGKHFHHLGTDARRRAHNHRLTALILLHSHNN